MNCLPKGSYSGSMALSMGMLRLVESLRGRAQGGGNLVIGVQPSQGIKAGLVE